MGNGERGRDEIMGASSGIFSGPWSHPTARGNLAMNPAIPHRACLIRTSLSVWQLPVLPVLSVLPPTHKHGQIKLSWALLSVFLADGPARLQVFRPDTGNTSSLLCAKELRGDSSSQRTRAATHFQVAGSKSCLLLFDSHHRRVS